MSNPAPPTFLTLPMEIRLQIYDYLYHPWHSPPPPSERSGIASVCQQTRRETFPFILRVPRYFGTAERLWEWTLRGDQKHLDFITEMSVMVLGDSLSKFWALRHAPRDIGDETVPYSSGWWEATYLKRVPPAYIKPVSIWRSIINTISKLLKSICTRNTNEAPRSVVVATWQALSSLPNLQKLAIAFQHPLRYTIDGSSTAYPGPVDSVHEQNLILEMVSNACPTIHTLVISNSSERLNLSYLTKFHNLRHLNFNGRISTSPEDALQILRSLKSLNTIALVRPPSGKVMWPPSTISSITPDIISKMNPLRSLSLMHLTDQPPSDLFSAPMLRALTCHRNSLRSLVIDVFHRIEGELMEGLLTFISTSYLTELTIMLSVPKPFAYMDVHSYFPATIKKRHASFIAPKERETWGHPWMNEVLLLNMRGAPK
jgi:hypothetical protein